MRSYAVFVEVFACGFISGAALFGELPTISPVLAVLVAAIGVALARAAFINRAAVDNLP